MIMDAVFLKILNMSITASWLILAVIFARSLLNKVPRWIICLLWGLVAIRLVCPFSFESVFSLIPSSETIPADIAMQHSPAIDSGITIVNETINPMIAESFTSAVTDSANPLQIYIPIISVIWLAGVAVMLGYALISYLKLKKEVSANIAISENVFACDEVKAPFILGIFRPQIYVPSSMQGETLELVIRHENAHLKRYDHLWKPFGYLLLAVYWFNPLCWAAYILLCRDIEMACDEKVIRDMDKDNIAAYSQALLDCSFSRRTIAACPLAFGEAGVKERVKGILNYRRPTFWIMMAAAIVCIGIAACLMTDPFSNKGLSEKLSVSMDMAVAEHNRSSKSEGHFAAADYDIMLVKQSGNETTVYAWVLYEEYSFDGKDVKLESGSHIPTAITFATSNNSSDSSTYDLIEYWQPRDGSYYAEDIKAKFPWYIRRKAMDIAGSNAQHENCLRAAREYYGVNTMNGEPDLSFLNYENAISLIADALDVQTIYYPPAGKDENGLIVPGYVDGSSLAKYLDLVSWKQSNAPSKDLPSPGSIQFVIRDDYRITIYKDAKMAIVKFGYDARFYKTQSDDYEKAVEMFYTEAKENTLSAKTQVAYANYTADGWIFAQCLNPYSLAISSARHLPVYRFETTDDLAKFKESVSDTLAFDQSYNEVPSFDEVTLGYDDAFFKDHTVILAYVTAGSGSYRFEIQEIEVNDSELCLNVIQTNHPEVVTSDMAGWFVIAELANTGLTGITEYDAKLIP
jgi:beta-lactamase regulating signal transducer with metallopeptidase domain